MQDFQQIKLFLAAIRRRLVLLGVVRATAYLAAAVGASWLGIALIASRLPPSATWRLLVVLAALGALAASAGLIGLPLLRLGRDEAVARVVGTAVPRLRSDLLSAVELGRELGAGGARFSAALAHSLAAAVARGVGALAPGAVAPLRPLGQPALAVGGVAVLYALCAWTAPGALG
ncbi:MAG TPA: hypothetical protein VGQ83_30770, partial [Polyangia bacterium]